MWDSTIVELIDMLLAGYELDIDDLERLLEKGRERSEGHYLEVKQGHPERDRSNPADTIRRYLSGFANSDGGILLLGVNNDWEVVGYSAPGNADSAQWANDCIQRIASNFSPLPRFQVVNHADGSVLVAVATRSLNLVPIIENSRQRYYLRIHDQTRSMPDWMISDLMLGRRAYPYLHISDVSISNIRRHLEGNRFTGNTQYPYEYLSVDFAFLVENESLFWAEDVSMGMIGWVLESRAGRLNNHLLAHVTIQNPSPFGDCQPLVLRHLRQSAQMPFVLDPFSERIININGWNIPLKCVSDFYMYTWNAALYVIARETPPVWYRLSLTINSNLLTLQRSNAFDQIGGENLRLMKTSGGRPTVSWSS